MVNRDTLKVGQILKSVYGDVYVMITKIDTNIEIQTIYRFGHHVHDVKAFLANNHSWNLVADSYKEFLLERL